VSITGTISIIIIIQSSVIIWISIIATFLIAFTQTTTTAAAFTAGLRHICIGSSYNYTPRPHIAGISCDRGRYNNKNNTSNSFRHRSNVIMGPPAVQPSSFLSVEQLRWKRLIAFGIENATPVIANSATSGTTTTKRSVAPRFDQRRTIQSPPESDGVIDLLDDEENQDEGGDEIPTTKNRKREYYTGTPTNIIHIDDDDDRKHPSKSHHKRPSKKQSPEDDDVEKPMRVFLEPNQNHTTSAVGTSSTGSTERYDTNPCCFQVATWNVWFGPWGDGNPHSTIRMKAIVQILMQQQQQRQQQSTYNNPPLYCIGFQEVVSETMRPLKSLLQQQHRYHWFEQPPNTVPYRCAMALHSNLTIVEHGWIPYTDTAMQRGFLYARAKLPPLSKNHHNHPAATYQEKNDEIIFTTTHLESFTGKDYNGGAQRLLQIQQLSRFLQKQMTQHPSVALSIISGDLNWDDERPSRTVASIDPILLSSIPSDWKDTWLEVKRPPPMISTTAKATKPAAVEGYTYDSKLNPMLSGSLRRRFDRVLVYLNHKKTNDDRATPNLQIRAPQLLGTDVISADLTWEKYNTYTQTTRSVPTAPSDHFGYIVTLQMDD
jgi:hypothetical protein